MPPGGPGGMSDLIDGYASHLRAAGYSRKTIADRRYILGKAARELPHGLEAASVNELEAWLGQWTGWTLCTYWGHLAGFYQWASRGTIPHVAPNPVLDLIRPRQVRSEPRPATEAQLMLALT